MNCTKPSDYSTRCQDCPVNADKSRTVLADVLEYLYLKKRIQVLEDRSPVIRDLATSESFRFLSWAPDAIRSGQCVEEVAIKARQPGVPNPLLANPGPTPADA